MAAQDAQNRETLHCGKAGNIVCGLIPGTRLAVPPLHFLADLAGYDPVVCKGPGRTLEEFLALGQGLEELQVDKSEVTEQHRHMLHP